MVSKPLLKHPLSLRLILVLPFVLQTFAAVGLVGYLSFRNGQQAVNNLASQLQQSVGDRVDQHLDSYLALPHQINQLNLDLIDRGLLDVRNLDAANRHFWKQAKMFKNFSFIGASLTDRTSSGAGRWIKGQDLVLSYHPGGGLKDYTYTADAQGRRSRMVYETNYDPLADAWYTETAKAGTPIWSRIYVAEGFEGYIAASANAPIYGQNRKLTGVVSIDLFLSNIDQFLQQIKLSPSGKIFIMERNGLLVANSGNAPSYKFTAKDKAERIRAIDSSSPRIQKTAVYLQQRFGSFQSIQFTQQLVFTIDGQQHFVQVMPWRDQYGLDWLIVVDVPESDFMTQIHENTRTTVLLCIAALVGASVLGFYTSRWITQPILQLGQASKALADGNFSQQIQPTPIRELNLLGLAFNRMADQLRSLFMKLETANAELEHRVEVRTAELTETLQDLSRTQAQIVQSEKMSALGQMVAGVAHEINNPVGFIHGNLSYVQQYTHELLELVQLYHQAFPAPPTAIQQKRDDLDLDFLEQDLEQVLRSMEVGTNRIREIVLSLRNFSRLDESGRKLVNLHDGIDSTLLILQHRLKANHQRPEIRVIRDYAELPNVECYAGQLNQVFMNLLSNAIDALDDRDANRASKTCFVDSSTIRISTKVMQTERDRWISIQVADNGVGISDEVRSRIFDPFFTTKPIGKGTGLGLSISYQIVTEKHQGKLECNSIPGQGTEFIVLLPLNC